jgi:hypothetical protein
MTRFAFSQMRQTRLIAASYSRLQGLRGLPVGFGLFAISFWANAQRGPAPRPVTIPVLLGAVALALYWLIDRYYVRAFGKVHQARGSRRYLELIGAMAGTGLALAAFYVDVSYRLPFSATGLILAGALLLDYLLAVRFTEFWYMPFWPMFALLIGLLSILPLLGLDGWWEWVGARAQILGITMLAGLDIVIASAISHLYFTWSLSAEVSHGRSL